MDGWCARRRLPRGGVMPLDQAWEMIRRWYAGRIEPSWRGRSAEAAQAIFEEVGLTGDFWRMT